jgi:putative redox protein
MSEHDVSHVVDGVSVAIPHGLVQAPEGPYRARARWIEGEKFIGESGSGHAVVMDGMHASNVGVRPMEMFLLGLGGCTAVDVMRLLRGLEEKVTACDIDIEGVRAKTAPMVFTRIHAHYVVTGHDLSPLKVQLAIKLSRDKFCSASAMLAKTAEMTHDFEIRTAE